jgi:hypothetical protein
MDSTLIFTMLGTVIFIAVLATIMDNYDKRN